MSDCVDQVYLRLRPKDIDFLNKIIEGYDGLGIVSTLDRREGLVVVRVTPDTRDELLRIVRCLHFPVEILPDSFVCRSH